MAKETHEEVGEVPDEGELGHAAEEDHEHDAGAEEEQVLLGIALEEGDVDFAVVVVADDRAEGEHQDQDGDGRRSQWAEDARKRCLSKAMPVSSPPIVYCPVKRTMKAVAEQTIQVST